MQGPDLIFHLTDENFNFYQPDRDGLLILSSNPYFFQFSPDGSYNITVNNIRNKTYWAVDRSVSIPLNYLGDAAKILKSIVLTRGTEQVKVYLTICSQQLHYEPGVNYSYYYKKEFRGNIDLSTYTHEGVKVTLTTQEDGLPKWLKANENNTLELPMNVPEAINVKMDGVTLKNNARYGIPGIQQACASFVTFENRATIPLSLLAEDGNGYGLLFFTVSQEQIAEGVDYIGSSQNYAVINTGETALTFTIEGTIKLKWTQPITGQDESPINIYFQKTGGQTYMILDTNSTPVTWVNGSIFSFPYSLTVTLNPGEKLFAFVTIDWELGRQPVSFEYQEDSTCEMKSNTRKPATYVPHLTGQYIFEKLIEFVTESEYQAAASAFLNLNRNILFTCGDAIRGLKDSSGNPTAVMKISLKKFFKFWDCLYAAGLIALETDKQVNIDEKVNLSDRTKVIQLASPETPPKVFLRKDLMWNVLKIGYPEIKNEVGVLNGNEAFCCGFEWRNNATVSPAEINKICEIKTDCYEQEIIRITLTDKDTTDNKRDNDVYANYCENELVPAGTDYPAHRILSRGLNATATGLLERDTIWNLRLSPKRMLLNNGGFLRSSMLHCDGLTITYSTADKNNRVAAGGITEKENIQLGSAGTKFFYPVGISMELPPPANLLELLNASPLTTVLVEIGGVIYTGTLEKSSIALAGNRTSEFEILLDERNDLSQLIDYNG